MFSGTTLNVHGCQVKKNEIPINETNPIRPSSPYAVSKVTQDLLGYTYYKSYNLNIIRTRMFTYINPRRSDLFATSFARQIARIEAGLQDTLFHGNLKSIRTLLDVRDAMRAYWLAAKYCNYGEVYNIGGSYTISVGEFLDLLISQARVKIKSKVDKNLLRPSDVTLQIPDSSKFIRKTKWKQMYSVDESIKFLLGIWRKKYNCE